MFGLRFLRDFLRDERKLKARAAIATEMLRNPESRHYGYELSRAAHVSVAKVYPYLADLIRIGYVTDGWQTPEEADGKPQRRYYVLTSDGVVGLRYFVGRWNAERGG